MLPFEEIVHLDEDCSRLDYFKLFITDEMIGLMVTETNSTKLYWSSDKSWRVPAIADVMGYTRFEKIRQYFHLNDSAHFPPRNSDNYDPLHKIRPLLDHVRNTCQAVYKPQCKLSVDEAMLAEDLLERKTYSCATIRAHRKGWPLPKSKQKKGVLKMRQKGLIVATQWTDKQQVNILSTNSDPVMTTVERRSKTGMLDHEIPLPVVNYNCGMFGVDLADQHHSYYPVGHKVADQLLTAATRVALLDTPSVAGRSKPYNSQLMLQPGRKRRCFQCSKMGTKQKVAEPVICL
ncbi:piggyBac transposable element-derived protein 4 [Biomphalaria pfeifferi]|uniref:PiggyBac transposable element-derived protein 4 n=1 Tax=Biomphalaria pfeifferi TaxID=112525 RepID=A0AAD8C3T3_BIOPF|nr:piggyBac transposable element-derived protein 4 [Biomphalaria pfeifferi]